MMDSISSYFIICVVCFPSLVVGTVTISFDPVKTPLTNSVDITCSLTGSSSNAVTWNFGSATTSCGSGLCSPDPSPHTYSMSGNEYTLTLPSAAIANCISYSCADAVISADTISEDLFVSYFDQTDIVPTEPGANTDGTISVTTGCVLSASDLSIVWYKIENGEEVEITSDINSDRSTCIRTCHSEEDKKVTCGFNHTEYTGQNSVEVQYKVNVSHKSYPDAADHYTWTSASYNIEKTECTCDGCKCKKKCQWIVILSIIMGVLGILLLLATRPIKEHFGRKTALVVVSIGILCGVISLVLGIVVQAIDCCEYTADCCKDLDCCKDECKRNWIENTGVAFIVIGVLVGIAGGVIFYLLWTNRMGPGNNGGNGFFCFNNGNDDGNDGGNDSGNNGHHRGRGTNSSTVHTERADTHRGTLSDRANSDGEVSRKDVHVQENRDNFSGRPMPPIPPLTDKKGRGLSANYDDDHPMTSVGIPDKKAGQLVPLKEQEEQKKKEESKKRRKRKKKAVSDDDDDDDVV